MKISQTNNVNFGYNKRLNQKLVKKLEAADSPLGKALLDINSSCNATEEKIQQLEKAGVDRNENLINILWEYLYGAKVFLCKTVDTLFPELNFTKTECDTYDRESQTRVIIPEDACSDKGVKTAYIWRDVMIDALIKETERNTSYSLPKIFSPTSAEIEDEYARKQKDYLPDSDYASPKTSQKTSGENDLDFEKFIPGEKSPKSLDDVIGLESTREDIKNFIIFPLLYPEEAKQRQEDYGIEIPHFVVFSGPPGCGKTMLAEAIAAQTGCEMYKIDLSTVGSSYVNGTVLNISEFFEEVYKKAEKSQKPVLVFMDEMDSILSKRDANARSGGKEDNKVVNTLLPIITAAADKNVIILGATNMYDAIDPAVKRRVEMNAYIGLPSEKEIAQLLSKEFQKIKKGQNLAQDGEKLAQLAKKLSGQSPSNIVNLAKEAAKAAYTRGGEITADDVLKALSSGVYEKVKEEEYIPENKKQTKRLGFQ